MDAADLKVFESVARNGSMNRAASELNTVQSNVTARIRALEDRIGVTLFHRHPKGVALTPAGERMLPFAGKVAKLLAEAVSAARDDGVPRGEIAVGTLETTAAIRLSPILSSFSRQYPAIRLTLTTGTTESLVSDVLAFRLDGAFVAGPVSRPDLSCERVFQEELVLVTAPDVASPEALTAADDLRIIVFRRGCSYRKRLDTLCHELGLHGIATLEFGSIDAILSCLAAGIGVTLLPRAVVANAMRTHKVAMHALSPDRASVDTMFIRRREAYLTSALAAFIRTVQSSPEAEAGSDPLLVAAG
jgi:LysR family transcriptional regulator, cell division regulator